MHSDRFKCHIMLTKDQKPICRTQLLDPPFQMPLTWNISAMVHKARITFLSRLPLFLLLPAFQNLYEQKEWGLFLRYLQTHNKVAVAKCKICEFYILPPDEGSKFNHAVVAYMEKSCNADASEIGGKVCESTIETSSIVPSVAKHKDHAERNYARMDPSYLRTLSQTHLGWIFGAIAELVDNSRDAKATKLNISIEVIYCKKFGADIPMMSLIDDGHGMTHQEIWRMISFGHKQPDGDDPVRIGRFGVGFKTGAMRLGRDALVLTQTANSRSIAFLSQSLNEGNNNLEIPIISYSRKGKFMEVDTSVQCADLAKYNLNAIKENSPFNKYLIGEKAGLFCEKGTGTQIYIWNLDEWGSDYCLEWQTGVIGGSSFHQGDILIRSRRTRSRPGQISQKAYKRVGGMIHSADMGRGVIGVIDVTDLMNDKNGRVWVHNNKQSFLDCEEYARLEQWLGKRSDDYWDKNFDTLQLKRTTVLYKPDHDWVQCDKCRKWRLLNAGFDSTSLPEEWFCYMDPYNGNCENPEEKVEPGVITVSAKRSGHEARDKPVLVKAAKVIEDPTSFTGKSDDDSSLEEDVKPPFLKRFRRGPSRACRKA